MTRPKTRQTTCFGLLVFFFSLIILHNLTNYFFLATTIATSRRLPRKTRTQSHDDHTCESLTRDLKDATFQGFDTFKLAAENYRSVCLVNIRRVPGDDLQYGQESEGMQDAISL
jgi:hypothetical protein